MSSSLAGSIYGIERTRCNNRNVVQVKIKQTKRFKALIYMSYPPNIDLDSLRFPFNTQIFAFELSERNSFFLEIQRFTRSDSSRATT